MSIRFQDKIRIAYEGWIALMIRRPAVVLVVTTLLSAGLLWYSATHFALETDLSGMISENLPFRRDERDFQKAFPALSDTILIVIDGATAEGATAARERLAAALRKNPALFPDVFEPGGGPFFDHNGLLYLDTPQLQDLSDNLAAVQPFLGLLADDLSLPNLLSVVGRAIQPQQEDVEIPQERLDLLFDEMGAVFEGVAAGNHRDLSWQKLIGEVGDTDPRRQFIVVRPHVDPQLLSGAAVPLNGIRRAAADLSLDRSRGVTVRLTGDVALANENLEAIRGNLGLAIVASFILVTATLAVGVRWSPVFVAANLLALGFGLVWTLAFAVFAVGAFNLISVAFAVIYIGIGIDFSILLCLVYRDFLLQGKSNCEAIAAASLNVGKGLFLCMAAEMIGFYSFVPTAYAGASDLGLIAGTGVLINLAATFTVVPALLALFPLRQRAVEPRRVPLMERLTEFPFRRARGVAITAAAVAAGCAFLLPKLYFDYNPLNLYNPDAEAVKMAQELFRKPETSPWTASALAASREEAQAVAERLKRLPEVKGVATVFDFVPQDQETKLAIVEDMALFMPAVPPALAVERRAAAQDRAAVERFAAQLQQYLAAHPENVPAADLYRRLTAFLTMKQPAEREKETYERLETALLGNLPPLFRRLELSLQPEPVAVETLPQQLVAQYVGTDGQYRVQIFPREDVTDVAALKRFVTAVRRVAPRATDSAVSIYESGSAVVSSFGAATAYALVAITLFLLFELRSLLGTVLVLLPFGLALLLTAASSVLLGIPLNFANIIIVPLLLGLGIDNDIHLIYRFRRDPAGNLNVLQTSTTRAVFYNTATNVVGFITLALVPHRGLASMGYGLSLCMTYVIICTVAVLPALIRLCGDRLRLPDDPEAQK